MRALCWHGKKDIRCDTVPDPTIEAPRNAIVRVTSCAICGSDLHLYDGLSDEQVLFLGDIFPTGWQAVVQCDIEPTDTVAIWGCGPVGQFCIRSAILLGAKQVIAIDRVPERLSVARAGGATTINFDEESVVERLNELTSGKGPEKCIDAVGMEAHASATLDSMYDRAKQAVMLETDRPDVLREMMYVCRPAGMLSVPGVYGGLLDKIPFCMVMNKSLRYAPGRPM